MRKQKAVDVLRLAVQLQGTRMGMTYEEISEAFQISRRTAERLKDAVAEIFPGLEQSNPGETPKRWRLPPRTLNSLITVEATELAALENSIESAARQGLQHLAENLESLRDKVRAIANPPSLRAAEPDLEALSEAQGIAARPGPRPHIERKIMERLREAILGCYRVRLHYKSRGTGMISRQLVCPYGFLYGNRHYLVAYSLNRMVLDYRLFSLSNISRVEMTEVRFERRPDFSMEKYLERSFGVFQEEPFEVAWKFSPEAAPDAREFNFHPTQRLEELNDGSLIVRFVAGGALEMSWHLYTWGAHVEVLEPEDFWEMIDA